jgi:putative ABC transport system permease protein
MPDSQATRVAVKAAWSCLTQHRWRSILTLAVCAAGTAGVLLAGILSDIYLADVRARLRTIGGRLVVVSPNKLTPYPGRIRQLEHFISLVEEDGAALSAQVPELETVVPVAARDAVVRMEGRAVRVRLVGTTAAYLGVRGFRTAAGRFLSATDESDAVVVLGDAVSRQLRPQGVRPGETVDLGAGSYQVIGILEPQGVNFAGEDEDHQIFVPLETYRRRIANRPWLSYLYLELDQNADVKRTVSEVQQILRNRHGRWRGDVDDAIVLDFANLTARQSDLLATAAWAVSITSGLLLIIGMVGIASLMLLIVRERSAEIGLRRALGAVPRDIANQFFLEGMSLAAAGVLGGCVLGLGLTTAIVLGWDAQAEPNLTLVATSLGVSLGAGALASAVPAIMAARVEPAAALRR